MPRPSLRADRWGCGVEGYLIAPIQIVSLPGEPDEIDAHAHNER